MLPGNRARAQFLPNRRTQTGATVETLLFRRDEIGRQWSVEEHRCHREHEADDFGKYRYEATLEVNRPRNGVSECRRAMKWAIS